MDIKEIRAWLKEHAGDIFSITEFESNNEELDRSTWFEQWLGGRDYNDEGYRFTSIGQDGTGGQFAIWTRLRAVEPHPLVFFGSEGGHGVIAKSARDWLLMIAHGVGVDEYGPDNGPTAVGPKLNYYFAPDYDDLEAAQGALSRYRKATVARFGDLPSFDELAAGRDELNAELRRWVARSVQ